MEQHGRVLASSLIDRIGETRSTHTEVGAHAQGRMCTPRVVSYVEPSCVLTTPS